MTRKFYSQTSKAKIVAEYKAGKSIDDIAKEYSVGKSTVYNWVSQSPAPVAKRNKHYSIEEIKAVLKQVRAGGDVMTVSAKAGISSSTCYLWMQKYKDLDLTTTAYTKQFKRNVINSLHDGHSKQQVCSTYGITTTVVNDIVNEFKDGVLDAQVALKAVDKPTIQTVSTDILDNFTDVLKLLVNKGLDVDSSIDVAKQLSVRLK